MRKPYIFWVLGLVLVLAMIVGAACAEEEEAPEATATVGTPEEATPTVGAEVPGVTDTEVILGTHTSLTGPIAAYNIIPRFTKAYFDYINETEGGVNGRKITYLEEDDQYSPPKAVDLTRKLVEQDKIFAMFNALGTPNHLQVIDYLQERGVPDMYVATGAVEWVKDPSARPLVFGSNPNYTGEGLVIGKYIADNYAGGKLGIIYQNDDFGIDGAAGVRLGVGDALEILEPLPYEVVDPDLFSQISQLRSAEADAVVIWATPLLLGTAIKHARQDLGWDVPFFISAVSVNELTALIAGPENIEGTVGPAATFMPYHTDQPGVARHLQILEQTGIGTNMASVLTMYAQYVAELMVETLRRAEEPLTREGLVAAAESIEDWTCSICLGPVTLGPDDHDPAQTVAISHFEGGKVVITGPAYTYEGVSVADLSVDALEEIPLPEGALEKPQ